MESQTPTNRKWFEAVRQCCTPGVGLTAMAMILVVVFHRSAAEDRMLLTFYYVGIIGTAYSLVRRRELALSVLVITVAAGTTLGYLYALAKPDVYDPLLDPLRDLSALFILLVMGLLLGLEAYRFQREDRERRIRDIFEANLIKLRAAALTRTSHEVRTPLSSIIAISDTLVQGNTGPLNDVQRDFLQDLDQAAQHLMGLINDILDYAKAEAGMISLVAETVALPELIDQCVSMVNARAQVADISINTKMESDVNEVVADPLRLKQIIVNLLSNAIKYNERGGVAKIRAWVKADKTLISVRDTGRGIEPEHMEHLFDPYYQAAHMDQGIGTGLGLSIIKHLVELHGGEVMVESIPGSGSVFTVSLPTEGIGGLSGGDASSVRDPDQFDKDLTISEELVAV